MNLTVKAKLLPLPDQKRSLLATMQAFNDACNFVSQTAWKEKCFSQIFLHRLCYYPVRKQFGLTAQLAVRVIGKVAESYRSEKNRLHVFKKYSAVVYDQRILSFKDLDSVSITTVGGRFKIPIVFGEYARLDQRHIRGQADLIYVKGHFYLCLVVESPDGIPITPKGFLGVDMGIEYIATSSDGEFFSGKGVDAVRSRITRLKTVLQKRNTKSAKRHLKKISDREARFKRTMNHVISKRLVSVAKDTERGIAVEALHGFRKTVRKAQRERFGKWAFGQLRRFIEYKANLAGIPVSAVNPRYTSQMCSRCGHIARSNRKAQSIFSCIQCSFSLHADLNAARNIASRADVNRPIAVHLESLTSTSPGTAMPHRSAVR